MRNNAAGVFLATLILLFLFPSSAHAQLDADFRAGGGLIVGTSTTTCAAGVAGGVRYSSALSCIEICDGASWGCMVTDACDSAPAFFAFTDLSAQPPLTLVTSNIVAITGMSAGCNATVSVSGTGSPEYRICSTSNCSSVDVTWTAANSNVAMQGKYLQLRATTSASAGATFTVTANVGAGSSTWNITTAYADCSGNPVGTVCGDGTVYAGTSPDGNVPLYVTRCDVGQSWTGSCTGARVGQAWNDGGGGWVETLLANCGTAPGCAASGASNTAILINTDSNNVTAGVQPHVAAQHCADLNINGQTDWYLPSAPELNVMYTNKTAVANFDTSGGWYSSSSEYNYLYSWHQRFSDGIQGSTSFGKNNGFYLRCARRNADVMPTSLSFTDQTNQTAAALISSNIVQITGIDTATSVTIINKSGDGTGGPEYRTCSDSSCSIVVTGWNSTINAISNNQYLQLRMYANGAASAVNRVLVIAGTGTDQWDLTTSAADPCAGSPAPGAVCADGSIYAGLSPDGNVAMYVTRCDAGQTWSGSACTGSAALNPWNAGNSGNYTNTSLTGCAASGACAVSGETNTNALISEDSDSGTAGTQPHIAAQYCADLNIHGQTDWYLPSAPELNVLYTNRFPIGMLTYGAHYQSSSECDDPFYRWKQTFSSGGTTKEAKDRVSIWPEYYPVLTRCARR